MPQLVQKLDLGVTDSEIERWEKSLNRPTKEHVERLVEFLGSNSTTERMT
jgi:hypothetical protein